jgi:hypothetical protein
MTTSKVTGIGWTTLTVADASSSAQDLREDITNLSFSTPRGVQETTGIQQSAMERLLLLADFSITMAGVFDPGSNLEHEVFGTIPSTSVIRAVSMVVAGCDLACNCYLTDYQITRSNSGELTWSVPGVLADGNVPTWSGA